MVAGDLDRLLSREDLARVEEIGLRGEFTYREQVWLRDTLLCAVDVPIPNEAKDADQP